jgi:hypothetical protein
MCRARIRRAGRGFGYVLVAPAPAGGPRSVDNIRAKGGIRRIVLPVKVDSIVVKNVPPIILTF